jgi:hypothetical protein
MGNRRVRVHARLADFADRGHYAVLPAPRVLGFDAGRAVAADFFSATGAVLPAAVAGIFFLCERLGFSAVVAGAVVLRALGAEARVGFLVLGGVDFAMQPVCHVLTGTRGFLFA